MSNPPTLQQALTTRSRRKKKKIVYDDDDEEDLLLSLLVSNAPQFKQKKGGGSRVGKSANLPRGHLEGNVRLMRDYFDADCIYPERLFRATIENKWNEIRKTHFLTPN